MFRILLGKERIKAMLLQSHISLNFRKLSSCSGALTGREPFPRWLWSHGSGRTEHPGALGEAVKPSTGVCCSEQVSMQSCKSNGARLSTDKVRTTGTPLCTKALLRKQKGVRCTAPKAQVSPLNLCPRLHAYQQGPQCTPKTSDSCKGDNSLLPRPGREGSRKK